MTRTPARFTQADIGRTDFSREAAWLMRDAAKARSEQEAFVYFLRSGEFVKIGHSRRWKERLAHMQIGSPYVIVPLLVLKASSAFEKKLHIRFRTDHYRGEWFHIGPAIQTFIKKNRKHCLANSSDVEIVDPPEPEIIP